MNIENLATYLGIATGVIGLLVGYLQNRQKQNFQKAVRANSWFNFHRVNNSIGSLQIAIDSYKKLHKEAINPEVIELLAKADAFGQDVYKESIRHIHYSEPSFSVSEIDKWEADKKIASKDKEFFLWLAETSD